MKNPQHWLIRLILFLLSHLAAILFTLVLSTLLHLAGNDLFVENKEQPLLSSALSLFGLLAVLFFNIRCVKAQKKQRARTPLWKFCLWETVFPALYLLPLFLIGLAGKEISLFLQLAGYMYAPYLAFGLWHRLPFLAYPLYLAILYGCNYIAGVRYGKKEAGQPLGTEETS